jgi:hypothetical protein
MTLFDGMCIAVICWCVFDTLYGIHLWMTENDE